MCISVPAKVIAVYGQAAEVEVGSSKRQVLLCLEAKEVKVGSWVLLYAGAAIALIDKEQADETNMLLRQLA